jgi:hypothetical protein
MKQSVQQVQRIALDGALDEANAGPPSAFRRIAILASSCASSAPGAATCCATKCGQSRRRDDSSEGR